MASIVKYKGYIGEIEIDIDAKMLFGQIINIKDVLAFQGQTVEEATQSFRDVVDGYLAYCEQKGITPEKPFSGNIPFRTTPEIHQNIYVAARLVGKSINAWMNEILAEAAQKARAAAGERVGAVLA
jgi:predicted HicB family RNase H-like nuclease